MPLWVIYHPPSIFTDTAEKQKMVEDITWCYRLIPRHFVDILFIPVEPKNYFCGNVQRPSKHDPKFDPQPDPETPHVRITIEHIARTFVSTEFRDNFLMEMDNALKPYIADKGYEWEYGITEMRRDLWKVNGIIPPMPLTKAEKKWVEENKATPYEPADGGLEGGNPNGYSAQV